MKNSKSPLQFILRSVVIGLAAAFIVVLVQPEFLSDSDKHPVIQYSESPPPSGIGSGMVSYADAVAKAAPAVVNIYTTKVITERASPLYKDPLFRYFFGEQLAPRKRLESSLGSGVIVSDSGYVLTNNHVIEGADEIQVALRDNRSIEAKLVGTDPESDLAVLKITLDNLPTITFTQTDKVRVGDVALAIGNPFGVGQTVTMGIISATGRDRIGINTFENFIQTDAAINPGNSGGALINAYGHLIGINTAIFSKSGGSQGIGFAIPGNSAANVMQQIIESGHVARGWLGVELQDISPALAESFGLSSQNGAVVAGLLRDGPGHQAGLTPGDVIIQVNDVLVRDSKDVMNTIAGIKPKNDVKIKLLRRGKATTLTAQVGERPALRQNNQ